jgi:hypothetical protein
MVLSPYVLRAIYVQYTLFTGLFNRVDARLETKGTKRAAEQGKNKGCQTIETMVFGIENQENRFADMERAWRADGGDNLGNSGQRFQGTGRTTPPGGRDTECHPLLLRHGSSS